VLMVFLLADEDCSKDLILDTYCADPTLVSSLAASAQTSYTKTFLRLTSLHEDCYLRTSHQCQLCHIPTSGIPVFESFSKELRALLERFTRTIFEREQDCFCRSLFSIRKYYLNLWSTMCLLCLLLALLRLRCIRHAVVVMMSIVIICWMPLRFEAFK
jgi:hypothetical protein